MANPQTNHPTQAGELLPKTRNPPPNRSANPLRFPDLLQSGTRTEYVQLSVFKGFAKRLKNSSEPEKMSRMTRIPI